MNDEKKVIQIYNTVYKQCIEDGYPEIIATTCAIMCRTGAEIMADWKNIQWKMKAQTAFCYVRNCIGQCNTKTHPCELRQKFDDIMNGKWPTVEKIKTKKRKLLKKQKNK